MTGRLEKLIGMLGSDFDGERANAAGMIKSYAAKEGKTISELLLQGPTRTIYQDRTIYEPIYREVERVVYREKIVYRDRPRAGGRKAPLPRRGDLLTGLEYCHENNRHMTEWEIAFVADLLDQTDNHWPMTDRQISRAEKIVRKIVNREINTTYDDDIEALL